MKATFKELSEVKFKNEVLIRELKVKIDDAKEVSQWPSQTFLVLNSVGYSLPVSYPCKPDSRYNNG